MKLDGCVNVNNWQAEGVAESQVEKLGQDNWSNVTSSEGGHSFICVLKVCGSTGPSAVLQV